MKTLRLTVKINAKNNKIFYLSSMTTSEKNTLFKAKEEKDLKSASNILGINCENILKFGETKLSKPYSIIDYVGYFYSPITDDIAKINSNREKQYRDYRLAEDKQEALVFVIQSSVGELFSAKTALSKMKEEFCCLWWDYDTVDYDTK